MWKKMSLLFLVYFLLQGSNAKSQGCSMAVDTDIVVAIHDSASTMEFWWGRIVFSPPVITFLRNLVAMFGPSPRVRMSLVAYGSTVRLLAPFTSDQQVLQNSLNWQPQFGGSRTYDAVSFITRHFRDNARQNTAKIAIFLTNRVSDNIKLTVFNSLQLRSTDVAVLGIPFGPSPFGELRLMTGNQAQVTKTANSYHILKSLGSVRNSLCSLAEIYNGILSRRNPQQTGVPHATVVVLDHSDSTRRFQGLDFFWARALVEFGRSLLDGIAGSTGRCSAGLVSFSDDSTLHTSISDNFQEQKDTLETIGRDNTIPFSGSNITSAILLATRELSENTDQTTQKNIVIVIDGSPIDPAAMRDAVQTAADAGATIYALSLQTLGGRAVSESTLTDIAQSSSRVDAHLSDESLPLKAPEIASVVCPAA